MKERVSKWKGYPSGKGSQLPKLPTGPAPGASRKEDSFYTAIFELEKLLTQVGSEEWVNPIAKRFIMAGIRMSIKYLEAKCGS